MECLGLRQKPRVVSSRRSSDSTLICVFISFSFTLFSSSLCLFVRFVSTLSRRSSTPTDGLCRETNRRIGKLLRKEVGYTRGNEKPRLERANQRAMLIVRTVCVLITAMTIIPAVSGIAGQSLLPSFAFPPLKASL